MKNKFFILLIALVIVFGVGVCYYFGIPQFKSKTQSSSEPTVYVESTLENFHIAIESDELMNNYNSYHEYTSDEHDIRVIIWTDTDIKDFSFISIDSDIKEDKVSFLAGDILFSINDMSIKKPFVAEIMAPEILPINGISFVDKNGVKRYFAIKMSGKGEEEEAPYYFLEFENGGGLIPASPSSK